MSIYDLITKRRTVRKYQNKPMKREQIRKYINAARVAPSAMNMQPVKYISVLSKEKVAQVFACTRWAGYLPEYNPNQSDIPSAFVAVCTDSSLKSAFCEFDMGAAVENLILSALEDGVGACILGAIDKPKITELLSLPENLTLCYLVALGYSAEKQRSVEMENGNIKYYLENGEICVPKRSIDEVLIKEL